MKSITALIFVACSLIFVQGAPWDFNYQWNTVYLDYQGYMVTKNTSEVGFHLESPNVTDFGRWGEAETCPEGAFVTGFQLKVEPKNSVVDDTALNGIRFFCSSGENITSKIGYFGNWGTKYSCGTYAVGFELQSQPYQGAREDDTAANNLRLICAEGNQIEGFNDNGHVFSGAYYTGPVTCKTGQFLCGLQTQVERYQVFGDDTALNNLRAKCCSPINFGGVGAVPVGSDSLSPDIPILGVTRTTVAPSTPTSSAAPSTTPAAPTTSAAPATTEDAKPTEISP